MLAIYMIQYRSTTFGPFTVTHHRFARRLNDADDHNDASKCRNSPSQVRLPASLAQLHVAQRRQNERQCACRCCAEQFKHYTQIAGKEGECKGGDDERGREDEMAVRVVRLVWKPIVGHDFSTYEGFERKRSKHVEAETQSRNIDHEVIIWKVIQHVAEGFVSEGQVAC